MKSYSSTNINFVCLEGMAGAGKTSQAQLLKEYIEKEYTKKCFITAAFEGNRRKITEKFIDNLCCKNNPWSIMFIFQALHSLQYEEALNSLEKGNFVIADRWRETFFAYHNYFGPLAQENDNVRNCLDLITFKNLEPNLTFYLDLEPSIALKRFFKREKNNKAYLSLPTIEFLAQMRSHYLNIQKIKNWIYIDGTQSKEQIHKKIISHL